MVAEGDARQAAIVIVMHAPVTAFRTRRVLLRRRLMIASAGAALVAVEMRLLLGRNRQRDAGFQHRVATDFALRMRHHRIDDFGRLALALFLLLASAIMTAAAFAITAFASIPAGR